MQLETGTITTAYLRMIRRKMMLLIALVGMIIAVSIFAVAMGAYDIPLADLMHALVGRAGGAADVVVWNIRLPRIVAAIVTGWGLSLSGLGIQSVLKNPLGASTTLGISQGAACGAAFAIVVFSAGAISVTAAAFAGAMLATLIILMLARLRRLTPEAVILAGVALSSLFLSGNVLIQYMANETELAMVVFWAFGDVARSSWLEIGVLSGVVLMATVFLMIRRWDLNAFSSGDETARGVGVNVERVRVQVMAVATLLAAVATAFHGVINFFDLIAPHMARRLVGDDHRMLVPFSAILGALIMLLADNIGRILVGSGALPVGVITSFMGAPMFLYLLVRRYR